MENLSQHAVTRMQQRGIPHAALECLLEYGRLQYDHHGAAIVFLDKAARRRLARDSKYSVPRFSRRGSVGIAPDKIRGRGQWSQLEKHLDAYAVIATDGTITTVGHRYKRIPRL